MEEREILKKALKDLILHPENAKIYGENEDVSDLIESIRKTKYVQPLIVNSQNVVLSGNRRLRACKALEYEMVDVEVRDFDDEDAELEFIIANNVARKKTREQIAREARKLKEVEAELAKKRRNPTKKDVSEVPNLAPRETEVTGKARDIVANMLKLSSGQEVDRLIKVINEIDDLSDDKRIDDAELLRGVLNNRTVSAAAELAEVMDYVDYVDISDDELNKIKTGVKSPSSIIKKAHIREKEEQKRKNGKMPEEKKEKNKPVEEIFDGKETDEPLEVIISDSQEQEDTTYIAFVNKYNEWKAEAQNDEKFLLEEKATPGLMNEAKELYERLQQVYDSVITFWEKVGQQRQHIEDIAA